jgi:hypothetical protein
VAGDGNDDVIVGTGQGTVGTVKVFEYINGGMQAVASFTPFGPNYSGGIDVAVANVTGEEVTAANTGATDQIIVGMAHGGSTVKVYGYDDSSGTPDVYMLRSFLAFASTYTGGVTLTAADIDTQTNTATDPVNHDYASVIVGREVGSPVVEIWDAQDPTVTLRSRYDAFNAANTNGVNVAAGETDGERGAQIYVNLINTDTVRVFDGETSAQITTFTTYPPKYGTAVNMAVGGVTTYAPTEDDETTPTYYERDLVVVAANISVNQVPVDFEGLLGSPAGLNGSKAL